MPGTFRRTHFVSLDSNQNVWVFGWYSPYQVTGGGVRVWLSGLYPVAGYE